MTGYQYNDQMLMKDGKVCFTANTPAFFSSLARQQTPQLQHIAVTPQRGNSIVA